MRFSATTAFNRFYCNLRYHTIEMVYSVSILKSPETGQVSRISHLIGLLLLFLLLSEVLSPKEVLELELEVLELRLSSSFTTYVVRLGTCSEERGNVSHMKMMSRNISSLLSLVYPNFCIESRAGAKQSRILKNFLPAYLRTGIATLLTGSVPQSKLGAIAIQLCALASFHGLNKVIDQFLQLPIRARS